MQSEPGKALKTKLKDGLEVTLWDRWEYEVKPAQRDKVTLKNVVEYFEKTHDLQARDVFFGSIPLYMHALNLGKDRNLVLDKEPLITQVHSALNAEARAQLKHIDLTITFIDAKATSSLEEEKILQGVPPIRVLFAKK